MPSKGSTTQRDYGNEHQKIRERYKPLVASGKAICAKCDQPIEPTTPWDLGHTEDRTGRTGPEHATCNRAAGGRKRHRLAREAKHAATLGADTSRAW